MRLPVLVSGGTVLQSLEAQGVSGTVAWLPRCGAAYSVVELLGAGDCLTSLVLLCMTWGLPT